ncbi:ADP-ribosyltransferase domain-containing protein, partial [Neisseriaceae bacterium CCUG 44465]
TAHAASRWQRIERNAKAMPYLRYNPSASNHKRDDHKRYYGLILPVQHPIWQQIFPPNGYGCKCTVTQLTRGQAEREGISEEPDFEFVEVTNPRTGEVVKVPKDITPSFAHNHAKRVDAVLDLAAERHGKDFVRDVAQQTNDFLTQRVMRPNFDNLDFVPNLTLANSDIDIDDAQKIVYTHAGTGSQFGSIPVGKVGSFEWFKQGNRYFLMEYGENGVQLNRIKRSELAWLKHNEIMNILEENASPNELSTLQEMMQQIQELDYGKADFADKLAAYLYSTNGGYMAVNPALIQVKGHLASIPKQETIQMIRLIDDFLAHSPKYKGTTTRKLSTNRMPNVADFLSSHKKGNLVRYSNFSSTSKPDGEFGDNHPDILLTIHGKSGVDISQLSAYASEGEVLMPRHAVYHVINQYEQNGTVHIELEELSEKQYNGQSIIHQLSLLKG